MSLKNAKFTQRIDAQRCLPIGDPVSPWQQIIPFALSFQDPRLLFALLYLFKIKGFLAKQFRD